jgi:hypothetical protein
MADRHRRRTSSPSAPAGADLVPASLVFILSISLWFTEDSFLDPSQLLKWDSPNLSCPNGVLCGGAV